MNNLLEKNFGQELNLLERIKNKYILPSSFQEQFHSLNSVDLIGTRVFLEFSVDGSSIGRARFRLFDDKVPLTVANFIALCTGEKVLYYLFVHFHVVF